MRFFSQYQVLLDMFENLTKYQLITSDYEEIKQYVTSKKILVEEDSPETCPKPYYYGRRKTATARVKVVNGKGDFFINSKTLLEYFPRLEDRQQVLFPLHITSSLGKYDVDVAAKGGGMTGILDDIIRTYIAYSLCNQQGVYVTQTRYRANITKFTSRNPKYSAVEIF